MYAVKIYGAGSIGNHLAHASRTQGWNVTVVDVDPAALRRMQEQIYPGRYGSWDSAIRLCPAADEPRGGFDLILVGTPPDSHLPLALRALDEAPKALLIEKPLCTPSLDGVRELVATMEKGQTRVFVGYDHVVGAASRRVGELLGEGMIGTIETLDVEFREHWGGIFAAHPWLSGPEDSYLGFWERGGGASGEHSHAANLWAHFARLVGGGRVTEVDARLEYVRHGKAHYDKLCFLTLATENGLIGRVVQDVVTTPSQKRARVQGQGGTIEWIAGYEPGADAVVVTRPGQTPTVELFRKTRPQDFIEELTFIAGRIEGRHGSPVIDVERGLDTMLVVAAAHRSHAEGRRVRIDYASGYGIEALAAEVARC